MGDITGNGTAVKGLGGAAGFGETALLRGDDTVTKVDVSAVFRDGFTLGGAHYAGNQLYISTDGLVSFGKGQAGVTPPAAPYFAIFNADVDTRLDGEGAESGAVWLDVDKTRDCVTITWDHVGFYRRNATLTDTFQMQIFDRGGGNFDVVYRYQKISWTSGDLQGGFGGLGGTPATVGYRVGPKGAPVLLAASGDEGAELALDTALGNTGVKGLYVFQFGAASIIKGTAGEDRLHGTAAADTLRELGGDDVLFGSAGADVLDGGAGADRADYSNATGPGGWTCAIRRQTGGWRQATAIWGSRRSSDRGSRIRCAAVRGLMVLRAARAGMCCWAIAARTRCWGATRTTCWMADQGRTSCWAARAMTVWQAAAGRTRSPAAAGRMVSCSRALARTGATGSQIMTRRRATTSISARRASGAAISRSPMSPIRVPGDPAWPRRISPICRRANWSGCWWTGRMTTASSFTPP